MALCVYALTFDKAVVIWNYVAQVLLQLKYSAQFLLQTFFYLC